MNTILEPEQETVHYSMNDNTYDFNDKLVHQMINHHLLSNADIQIPTFNEKNLNDGWRIAGESTRILKPYNGEAYHSKLGTTNKNVSSFQHLDNQDYSYDNQSSISDATYQQNDAMGHKKYRIDLNSEKAIVNLLEYSKKESTKKLDSSHKRSFSDVQSYFNMYNKDNSIRKNDFNLVIDQCAQKVDRKDKLHWLDFKNNTFSTKLTSAEKAMLFL